MVINGNDVGDFEVKKIYGQQDWLAIRSFSKEWWRLRNLAANFSPEDFLRSNDKKVRRSNTLFDRELQNCEKSRKIKNRKNVMQRTFPDESS